jgi:hypothetical protein
MTYEDMKFILILLSLHFGLIILQSIEQFVSVHVRWL